MYDNDRDKELLQRPYKKLAAAEELINSNALLDLYVSLYKKKFRGEPIFPVSRSHLTTIKDISRATGEKAYGIIEQYFDMKDDWFVNQAYSLECLLKNLNKVNAAYSTKVGSSMMRGKLAIEVFCDCCWQTMSTTVSPDHNFDKQNTCVRCTVEKRSPRRVTKQEIRQTVRMFGSAFPEINNPT